MCKSFTGISERDILKYINTKRKSQQLNPSFKNNTLLTPVTCKIAFYLVQVDLVTMEQMAVSVDTETFKYILVVSLLVVTYNHCKQSAFTNVYKHLTARNVILAMDEIYIAHRIIPPLEATASLLLIQQASR